MIISDSQNDTLQSVYPNYDRSIERETLIQYRYHRTVTEMLDTDSEITEN